MSATLVPPVPADAPRWPALIPPVLIAIPVLLKLAGVPLNNAWIIFTLLVGLMLTGMPISISLGLTVLTYLFFMTQVPIESVALKLFTGIVGTLATGFVWEVGHTDSVSPDLELPKWIVYMCIPLGSYLMCFRFLQVAVSFARTGQLPHHDVAHVEGVEPAADVNPYNLADNLHPAGLDNGTRK